MKKIICFIVIIISIQLNHALAQRSDNLGKFEGTWQWKSGDSVFTITLSKVEFNGKKFDKDWPDTTVNLIIGWHELMVKGKVIESSMSWRSKTIDYANRNYTISGLRGKTGENTLGFFFFNDKTAKKYSNVHGVFKILPGVDKAEWGIWVREVQGNTSKQQEYYAALKHAIMQKIK